jgi:oxepin-CoA hydrolase/3-oxo-5,6-dehydrosuberyl-CoA semialdehyde dehydrogenase
MAQRHEVQQNIETLLQQSNLVYGSTTHVDVIDANANDGAFISPILLCNAQPFTNTHAHNIEAFGPVATLMPYKNIDDAIALSKMGKGSLVSSIVTANNDIAKEYVLGAGAYHGRILVLNNDCAKESTGHGSPLPLLVHGGPGRAGGGEEMGGIRGIKHYMQRLALQGSPSVISHISQVFQPNAVGNIDGVHPFTKHFNELHIGDQIVTERRTITAEDINKFADLSGDHFYAHIAETNFENTMFTHQVAHGYFIMSAAAGLFVDSYTLNPVLLNYGIDELRFTKPIYPGSEMYVRFTCKEKISQEQKEPTDIAKGIVKWLVEIFDETHELTGIATILTMVKVKV